jgi:hypothetical protein
MQEIIIIAGPNGAGKTSFAKEYLPAAREGLVYVNADEIARELAGLDPTAAHLDLRAGREMLSRIDSLVAARTEFMFETTLASLSYARKIPRWQARGYTVAVIYLRLPSDAVAIDRRPAVAPDTAFQRRLFASDLPRASNISNRTTNRWLMNGMFGIAWKASFDWRKPGMTDEQGGRHW